MTDQTNTTNETIEQDTSSFIEAIEALSAPDNPLALHLGGWGERLALIRLAHSALRNEPVTLSDLSKRVNLSRAAITSLADRLETMELAERVADPTDRRRTFLRVTAAGGDLVREGFAHGVDPLVAA